MKNKFILTWNFIFMTFVLFLCFIQSMMLIFNMELFHLTPERNLISIFEN